MVRDFALSTLFLPFEEGILSWPSEGRLLFLRARHGEHLARGLLSPEIVARLDCSQGFRPDYLALERAGFQVSADIPEEGHSYSLVLVLPPSQRDEARALLATAVSLAAPGATVVASAAKAEGARSLEGDLSRLLGRVESRSKHHCRVFWGVVDAQSLGRSLLSTWRALDRPRPVDEGHLLSRPGLFAWDRVDTGSALLARSLPADLTGSLADLGAGYGYLSTQLLECCPGLKSLDLYEAEWRALELARVNLTNRSRPGVALDFLWHDVGCGLPRRYNAIVTNPPFHRRREVSVDLGRSFIDAAARALLPGGSFWLVANRRLPYEETIARSFHDQRVLVEEAGYKVIQANLR